MRVFHPLTLACVGATTASVWPPPQSIATSGAPLALSPDFVITTTTHAASVRLAGAIARASDLVAPAHVRAARAEQQRRQQGTPNVLRTLEIEIAADATEHLGIETKYDYRLTVGDPTTPGRAKASASSIYGAMYALETFAQLIDRDCSSGGGGSGWACAAPLRFSSVTVVDAPDYQWRGLMVDSGRRFVPMDTLKNLVDTMAAVKLNVLHLHASDMCRFGVESKLYPNLTSSLAGVHAGFYSQSDVKELVAYAGDRGMRVVPEFDIPGHSRGWIPVESDGVQFCTDAASRSQLDGTDSTYKVLHAVLGEMAALFPDEVFNIGSDETSAKGVCTVQTSLDIEKRVLDAVEKEFNKTAEGWEEVLFDAGAATNKTIVNAWARHSAAQITATGRRAVESKSSAFYFTSAAPGGPKGWSKCWYDISTNVPVAQRPLLLGGEMSMWTDTYCYINQCGASGAGKPVGHALFDPAQDEAFGKSIGGMIWPRGYVGAAAFWNYNSTADPSSDAFVASIWATNDALASRGSLVCPTNCSCDQLSACGTPYALAPTPAPPPTPVPAAGASLSLARCALGASPDGGVANEQRFDLGADGTLRLTADPTLCVQFVAKETYPLKLAPCPPKRQPEGRQSGDNDSDFVFAHLPSAELVHKSSGQCLDVKDVGDVGTWECSDDQSQPNQHWAVDAELHTVVSLSTYATAQASAPGVGAPASNVAGFCLTAK